MVQAALEMSADDPAFEHWRQRFLTLYETGLGNLSHPYPALPELVADLHKAGIAWGVVTNKLSRFALPLMNKMSFDPAAGAIVTPDHVDQPKPDPESILLACEQLACEPTETLFIGDHLRDIEAGQGAGCFTIAAAYGYLAPQEVATNWQADAVAENSRELAEMISGMV
jgi:phosphoglycolate phosphatase